jgi:hypothetical protein
MEKQIVLSLSKLLEGYCGLVAISEEAGLSQKAIATH